MTIYRRFVVPLAGAAALVVLPGIPLLMLIGLCGVGTWLVTENILGSRVDWSAALILWSALLFVFAIVGLFSSYWVPRIVSIRRGWVRYVPDIEDWTSSIAWSMPLAVLLTLIFRVHGMPFWLYVLGAVSVVLAVVTAVDEPQLGRGSKKRKAGRRG